MRQFLALELPAGARDELAGLRERLGSEAAGWRFARPESVHLTLRFLGEVEPATDRRARDEWRSAAAETPPLSFRLHGLGVFPPRGSPRILWVGLADAEPPAALGRLAASLEQRARGLGFAPEERGFRPHLTLARAGRSPAPRRPVGADFASAGVVHAVDLALFRSEMLPTGARYTALARFPLGR